MKKIAMFSAVMVLGVGMAFAHTLNVPFFQDNAPAINGPQNPSSGTAAFIGIKNTTNVPIEITLFYRVHNRTTDAFVNTEAGTFILGADDGITWRPATLDTAEGKGSAIPDILTMGAADPTADFNNAGSATVVWTSGAATDILGRVFGKRSNSSFAYLLPAGQ